MLNDLFQNKGMAKTSRTPGKTQLLNFFIVDERLLCIDVPGYGFARVADELRDEWELFLGRSLASANLDLALLLIDSRREPSPLDHQMKEWLEAQGISTIMVLTKTDKLSQAERVANTKKAIEAFELPYVHYSTTKREGRQKLLQMVTDGIVKRNRICLP